MKVSLNESRRCKSRLEIKKPGLNLEHIPKCRSYSIRVKMNQVRKDSFKSLDHQFSGTKIECWCFVYLLKAKNMQICELIQGLECFLTHLESKKVNKQSQTDSYLCVPLITPGTVNFYQMIPLELK
jgi:hypothetical protein